MAVPGIVSRRIRAIPEPVVARLADAAFLCLVVAGCLAILWLGRRTTFRLDDWVFVGERPPYGLDYLMVPHNEHWSFFVKLPFQIIFAVVGMRSYLPYLALLLVVQGAAVLAVYAAVSAAGGRVLGFAVGSVMLFLGSAHEDLFWYSSVGFLLALATGAAAMWLLLSRPTSTRISATVFFLLTIAVMSSGAGLAFVAGLAVASLADPVRRRGWWGPVGAGLVYLGWYAIWGRSSVSAVTLDSLVALPGFVFVGSENAIALATGLGRGIGAVILVVMFGAVWLQLALGRRQSFVVIAGTVGLLTFLGMTALVRDEGHLGSEMASAPRYIPVSWALLALIIAGLLGRPIDRDSALLRAFVLALVLVFALASNGSALRSAADRYAAEADSTRATLTALETYWDAPAVQHSGQLPYGPIRLHELLAEYGSPTHDEIWPSAALAPGPTSRDRGLFQVVKNALVVVADTGGTVGAQPPTLAGQTEVALQSQGGCLQAQPLGPDGQVRLRVASGGSVRLTTDGWGDIGVYIAHDAGFQEADSIKQKILSQTSYRITVPDMGPGFTWQFAVKLGAGIRSASICSLSVTGP